MKTEDFKNIHEGKRCFIIGNGPSLNNTDLNLIKDEYSFGMNRIGLKFGETEWRPNYFVCPTGNSKQPNWKPDIEKSVQLGIPCWFWDQGYNKKLYGQYDNIIYVDCKHHKESAKALLENTPVDWFSTECEKWVSKYGTSLTVAMQMAAYMGFKEIYLLGCDLGFENKEHHFSDKYDVGESIPMKHLDPVMTSGHILMRKASEKYGFKIYNATVGGSLEVYERVDYNEMFKK